MPQISVFSNATGTIPIDTMDVNDFLQHVRLGKWRTEVERIRTELDPIVKKELKKTLPAVTLSGTFTRRERKSLTQHSGFICIDIDLILDRKQFDDDPYSYAVFKSCGGNNLAVLVKIDPTKHKESFSWLEAYYKDRYSITIDPKPSSEVSLRFVTYDPDCIINLQSKRSPIKTRSHKQPEHLPLVYTTEQIEQIVASIEADRKDLAPDYDSYTNIAFAFSHEMGQAGRELFHRVCRINHKYEYEAADRLYDNAIERTELIRNPDYHGRITPITIGTFYAMCKRAGVRLPESNPKPVLIAAIHRKDGASAEQIASHLVQHENVSDSVAQSIAQQVTSRFDLALKSLVKDPEHLIESTIAFIQSEYPLVRNSITKKVELKDTGNVLEEEDINDIYLDIKRRFNVTSITKDLVMSIIFSNHTPTYNPIEEFIQSNINNRTTGHIAQLIDAIETDTPYAAQWIRKWIIGIQAAIDGYPVRLMLVFTGPQYNGKTEFFRRLLPKELRPYYAESKLDRGKDDELLMCQKLIVMDDEMGGKSKQDEKRLKELTSKDTFSLRAPYAKHNVDYKRLAVLCGTSNPTEIINDPTGNTRILPVEVKSIDFDAINQVDRVGMFMEAYHAYKGGESWQLDKEEVGVLATASDHFAAIPFEAELIGQFFRPYNELDGGHPEYMTATEIKNEIEINTKQQLKNLTRLGIELRKMFGPPVSRKKMSNPVKCYKVVKTGGSMPQVLTTVSSYDNQDVPF